MDVTGTTSVVMINVGFPPEGIGVEVLVPGKLHAKINIKTEISKTWVFAYFLISNAPLLRFIIRQMEATFKINSTFRWATRTNLKVLYP